MLESEREMLRALIDNIPDLMYVKDIESPFVVANRQVVRSLGAGSHQELIGKTESDFLPSARADGSYEKEQRVVRSGEAIFNYEEVVLDGQGNQIPVLTTVVPLHDSRDQITGVVGVGRNLSERKLGENALAAAERKYQGMFDQALFGIFRVDPEGHLLDVNQAMANILKYTTPAEMLKNLCDSLWTIAVMPERNAEFRAEMEMFGHVRAFEIEVYRKDRIKIWISATYAR
jgi:PAS domain S-box-containing protein